jgi:hypothetical protein
MILFNFGLFHCESIKFTPKTIWSLTIKKRISFNIYTFVKILS